MSAKERNLFQTRISELKSEKSNTDVMIDAQQYQEALESLKKMQDPEYYQ